MLVTDFRGADDQKRHHRNDAPQQYKLFQAMTQANGSRQRCSMDTAAIATGQDSRTRQSAMETQRQLLFRATHLRPE
ncbi:MAG: hypothetical protein Fues2KO_00990 [Fuerstiella sp.]